jgi:hypothetical protein
MQAEYVGTGAKRKLMNHLQSELVQSFNESFLCHSVTKDFGIRITFITNCNAAIIRSAEQHNFNVTPNINLNI